jgi:xanthine dehydrogenase small subunit
MSIAALQLDMRHGDSIQTPDREQIDQHLAGNLCRCTGYGPIIDAARQACNQPLPDYWSHQQTVVQSILGQWQKQDEILHVECESGLFAAPRTEAELVTYLSDQLSPPTLLAGATDIGLWITKEGRQLTTLLHLGQISSLKTVNRRADELEIGAAVSLQRAEPELTRLAPDLGLLLRRFGARQVRSQGTIGGNIANGSPIGDLPPALIALGATLRIGCSNGQREIPLEDFFVDYGQQDLADNEYVASVVLSVQPQPHFRCWKIAKRFDQDISAVLGAFSLTLVDGVVHSARFCFGGMAPTPRRACRCEAAVEGRRLDEDTLAEAQNALQQDFDPIADLRASARYRRTVAANLLDKYFRFLNVTDVPSVYEFSSPQAFTHV